MMPKVSILVPIYNVSAYIERCAHSLFQQTFDDIEYVFVNDCTPDDSIEKLQKVIEQYPERQPHVRIVHHERNRGLAAARNTAIDNSSGQYIQVVDSDDWTELDMVEAMYKKALKENADIVVCDVFVEKNRETVIFPSLLSENRDDIFRDFLAGKICTTLWNKLIRRKLYELPEHRVPEGLDVGEDAYVIARLLIDYDKIVKVSQPLYHYNRCHQNGFARQIKQKHFENYVLLWNLSDDFFIKKNVYSKFIKEIELAKIRNKISLFLQTSSCSLRKQYAWDFRNIEMKYISHFRPGEKLMLFFTHYRMFGLAHLTQKLIVSKSRNERI